MGTQFSHILKSILLLNKTMKIILLSLFLLSVTAKTAFGVECYDYLAGEEPSSDSTCTDNKWCMKVTAKNDGNKASAGGCEGDMKRTRAVDNCDDLGDDCISESSNGVKMTVCCCDTDLCNSSSVFSISMTILFASIITLKLF